MNIVNLKLKIIFLLFAFCYLLFAERVAAQSLSVGIDPPILQIHAKPPAQIEAPIRIQNLSYQNATYNISLIPFRPKANGEIELDQELKSDSEYKHILSKVKIFADGRELSQVILAPRQTKTLTIQINIPEGEKERDYYFSIVFISSSENQSQSSSFLGSRGGIASNVLLSVTDGDFIPDGYIEQFSAPKFVTKGPVKFKLMVFNTSNAYTTVKGHIVMKNMFGQTIGNVDIVPVNILADTPRLLSSKDDLNSSDPKVVWSEKFLLGYYTADLTLAMSDQGPVLRKKITFFAFPVEGILAILLASIMAIFIIKRARASSQ